MLGGGGAGPIATSRYVHSVVVAVMVVLQRCPQQVAPRVAQQRRTIDGIAWREEVAGGALVRTAVYVSARLRLQIGDERVCPAVRWRAQLGGHGRSEERRVGKEGRSRW